jgi:hypothetical protein
MKQVSVLILAVFACASAFSLDVDRDELRVDPSIRIQFENYDGPPDKVETADQIRGIGEALGGISGPGSRGSSERYMIIRAVDPKTPRGLDADIFVLGRSAVVDHIRNLRFIVAGYLAAAFGYSPKDSSTLAEFITVYNAVYRGNLDYFASRFKPLVMSHLEKDKAGLALSYRQWPGATQMLIPLSAAVRGAPGAIDTGVISDRNVVSDLRTRDDRAVELRKDMVDIKERIVAGEEERVEAEKKVLQARSTAVAAEEKRLEKELAEVREKRESLPPESAAGEIKTLEDKERDITGRQAEIAGEKQDLERKASEIAAAETKIQETKDDIRQERRDIAGDQQEILSREPDRPAAGIPFITAEAGTAGRLVLVDPRTGAVLPGSPQPPVTVRAYERFGRGIAVILSRSGGGRLAVLEPAGLAESAAAREEVYPRSALRTSGGALFVVIRDSGVWRLGKYDAALTLIAKSRMEVNPDTFLVFSESVVFAEGADGGVKPLSPRTLE